MLNFRCGEWVDLKRKKTLWIGVALLCLTGCETEPPWQPIANPRPAPDFTLPTLDEGKVTLSGLRGQIVVMEFWASWCGPCRFSTPSIEVLYREYKDRGVTMLLINEGESPETIKRWAKQRFTAPILLDGDNSVGRMYEVHGIPRMVVVDAQGNVVHDHAGYSGGLEQQLSQFLNLLLEQAKQTDVGSASNSRP